MKGVSESMAGRAAIMQLLPFSLAETHRASLLHGGYPEVLARPAGRRLWFSSYIQTYLERDVRAVTNVRDLATFRRFLALLASRHGQILNKTDLAAPLGVSVPTIADWLHVLEITGQATLVPPYFENFGKRLIKSPKVYLRDSGIVHALLDIANKEALLGHPVVGASWEGFVIETLLRCAPDQVQEYFYRTSGGAEIDLLLVWPGGKSWAIEVKRSLSPTVGRGFHSGCADLHPTRKLVVYPGNERLHVTADIDALPLSSLARELAE